MNQEEAKKNLMMYNVCIVKDYPMLPLRDHLAFAEEQSLTGSAIQRMRTVGDGRRQRLVSTLILSSPSVLWNLNVIGSIIHIL